MLLGDLDAIRRQADEGSITLDGVSLTVNRVEDLNVDGARVCRFSINLIPHTIEVTTLKHLAPGRPAPVAVCHGAKLDPDRSPACRRLRPSRLLPSRPYRRFSLGPYGKYEHSLRFRGCASICLAPLGLARRPRE